MWKKETKKPELQKEEKIDISFSKRDSKATRFKGRLLGDLQKARNDKNVEMERYIWELLEFFNQCYPNKIVKYEVRIVGGWKGKDILGVYGFQDDFILLEHRKDKDTGEVVTIRHPIAHEDVNKLFLWIKRWNLLETKYCHEFAPYLGYSDWKALWKERKEYFNKYYYPIKILESLKIIRYSGRGEITRIK